MAKLFKELERKLQNAGQFKIKAGVLARSTYPDTGESVAKVARIQEYGTSRIPARPFLRNAVAANEGKWVARFKSDIAKYLRGDISLASAKTLTGDMMVADIKETIREGVNPPISEVTKMVRKMTKTEGKKKGRKTYAEAVKRVRKGERADDVDATPLYDTHVLYSSIESE